MPNSADLDTTDGWIKGDLPAKDKDAEKDTEPGGVPDDADDPETAPPAAESGEAQPGAADKVDDAAGASDDSSVADSSGDDPEATAGDDTTDLVEAQSHEPTTVEAPGDDATTQDGQPDSSDSLADSPAAASAIADIAPVNGSEAVEAPASEPPPRATRGWGTETTAARLVVDSASDLSLEALVESLLFVADGAIPVASLAEALEVPVREVEAALTALTDSYTSRGLSLLRVRDKVQLTTSPAAAARVERFLGLAASSPLSRAALEALAIIAYQQPVTRPQIESVRGVNSDSVIKNLLAKGLVEEAGRAEGPGRPVLYATTTEFMQHFGLGSLSQLPPLTPIALETADPQDILKG